jgi:phytoene dehydrogenase-like protein
MYDAIIIGAGISGLVCGCYLAKAGMKVLIAEQHYKPGGYCTSFKRGKFIFDAAAHSFGGYRKDGIVRKVFEDLEIDKKIKIKRFDPSDIIITPDYKISFWADLNKTINDFQIAFPDESNNIKNFFYFLINAAPKSFVLMRNWTFKDLLDNYFKNDNLKAILSFPLWGNTGLPPSLISAFIGIKVYTEFHIDGGYYPNDCMQDLPNILAARFKELGGELWLSSQVKKIKTRDEKVAGIVIKQGDFIPSKYVVSNCDAIQIFTKLFGNRKVSNEILEKLKSMICSLSMFIVYIGVDKSLTKLPNPGTNLWFLPHYSIEDMYLAAKNRHLSNLQEFMLRVSPNYSVITAYFHAPFKNKNYWKKNKDKFLNFLIKKIEKYFIPGLSKHIIYKDAATPHTLYRYTLNYKGASYGWAGIPAQFADIDFKKPSFVKNFYMTGHWTTQGFGIPGVMYSGQDIAKSILIKDEM